MPAMQRAMQMTGEERIAFLGGGSMARALIGGLLREQINPAHICVGEPRAAAREALSAELGVAVSPDNRTALAGAALVVLAVKPQDAAGALQALGATRAGAAPAPVLLSIAAGLRIAQLAQVVPPDVPIVRAMPNRPALVGAGVTGLYAPPHTPSHARALAELVGRAAGRAVWLRAESDLDTVTALSGSGPAYFFLLAEELARAAEALGLPAETAGLLAAETLYGAGALAHRVAPEAAAAGLAQERRAVTSRGGTTEAALRVLQESDFPALIARALQAAAARAAELSAGVSSVASSAGPPETSRVNSAPQGVRPVPPESLFGPGHRR